ncbi:MAG TPA: hypothetical protein PLF22_05310 [Pseudomonadales bacterium]|nr:hypothetical protein [Pseudomonadales bacterium]
MEPPPPNPSSAALVSLYAFTLLGMIGGWYILLSGGFYHQNGRHSHDYTYVDGPMALVMVAIEFLMTATGAAAIVQYGRYAKYWYMVSCSAVLVPPVLYILLGHFAG